MVRGDSYAGRTVNRNVTIAVPYAAPSPVFHSPASHLTPRRSPSQEVTCNNPYQLVFLGITMAVVAAQAEERRRPIPP